jgi:hypothetical protein
MSDRHFRIPARLAFRDAAPQQFWSNKGAGGSSGLFFAVERDAAAKVTLR